MRMQHACFYRGYEILRAGSLYICPKLQHWGETELEIVQVIDRITNIQWQSRKLVIPAE